MSHYRDDFLTKYPPDELEDNEEIYREARRARYPGVRGGFPGPQHFPDGYNAAAKWDEIDDMKEPARQVRVAYENRLRSSQGYVDRLEPEQSSYYRAATRGITPHDHRELQPMARNYADSEYRHASAREDIYGRGPMMYGTADSQRVHHGYVAEHYEHADYAEDQYATTSTDVEKRDPASRARDLYGRPVPAGYQPSNDPYPGSDPPDGYYSDKHGHAAPASYQITSGKMSQKQKRRNRQL
ncbi:MAG: hypothetical protein Q9180_008664 [Flavoplaca navasiana]